CVHVCFQPVRLHLHLHSFPTRRSSDLFAVDQAADGEEGLAAASRQPYDVAIVDVMLPRRDGLSVIEELRRRGITTPVLILSARRDRKSTRLNSSHVAISYAVVWLKKKEECLEYGFPSEEELLIRDQLLNNTPVLRVSREMRTDTRGLLVRFLLSQLSVDDEVASVA